MNAPRRLVVSIDDQLIHVTSHNVCLGIFPVSTAQKGTGSTNGSFRTPTGNFMICEKIGAEQPAGTIFKARVPIGQWADGTSLHDDLVLTRILRLEGLDSQNANTLERCIYIHGTNREDLVGQPAGHGCVRLRNDDMIRLFDMVEEGDLLEILPATRRRGKILFISLEAVLMDCEPMLVLAGLSSHPSVLPEVTGIIAQRNEGTLDPKSADQRCLDAIRPDLAMCQAAARICLNHLAHGARYTIARSLDKGWTPVMLSGVPALIAAPLAAQLAIPYLEAPQIIFEADDSHADSSYENDFDHQRVIKEWLEAILPERSALLADAWLARTCGPKVDVILTQEQISDLT